MRTEVKLNSVYYKLKRLPTQTLANQMASKVGQGASEYADLTTWSAWVQQTWAEGAGQLRPHRNGGFLYGEMETRVPEQMILPGLPVQVDTRDLTGTRSDGRYMPNSMTSELTVGASQTNTKIAVPFITPASVTGSTFFVWIYCRADVGKVLTFELFVSSGGAPSGGVVTSGTVTVLEDSKGWAWHGVELAYSGTLSSATQYWLALSPTTGTIEVGLGSESLDTFDSVSKGLQSGVWTSLSAAVHIMFSTSIHRLTESTSNTGNGFFRFHHATNGTTLYCFHGKYVYKYDTTNDQWDSVGTMHANLSCTGATVFDRDVWFGNSANSGAVFAGNAANMDDSEVLTDSGHNGAVFAKHAGYLYRGVMNEVAYSRNVAIDGWTMTDEMKVGTGEYPVTGMCGMNDSMYVSTAEALYRIAPGDFAVPVMPWSGIDDDNGRSMINHQGALYITANNRVIRLTEDHQAQDVWITREEDLAAGRIGKVWSLCSMGNNVVAFVGGGATANKPTVWALSDGKWHHLATLPSSPLGASELFVNYSVYYDRITDNLFMMTPQRVTYRLHVPEFAVNPYNDTAMVYAPRAWMEWDWFDGPVLEAPKDFESVTIIGENISSSRPIVVYWKDDDSTTWETLGTVDSNIEELRWTVAMGTRPNTKRFKLGILMATNSYSSSPRVRAIRVKYHLMVRDWFRWNVVVDVGGRTGAYQILADGTRNNLTAATIKDNIATLATRVPPFIYQDVDGSQYEVKIIDGNFQYTNYEYNESTTNEWWEGQWNLVLEQVTQSEYSP